MNLGSRLPAEFTWSEVKALSILGSLSSTRALNSSQLQKGKTDMICLSIMTREPFHITEYINKILQILWVLPYRPWEIGSNEWQLPEAGREKS